MTRKEQLLLASVMGAVFLGAAALYFHDRQEGALRHDAGGTSDVQAIAAVQPVEVAVPDRREEPRTASDSDAVSTIEEPAELAKAEEVSVSVRGAVRSPGLYALEAGSRVHDLIKAARGASDDADLSDINLAARLLDGSTLTVPARRQAEFDGGTLVAKNAPPAAVLNPPQYTVSGWQSGLASPPEPGQASQASEAAPATPAAPPTDGKVDLNSASQQELEMLPGIGPKTAEKIIAYRSRTPFGSVDELANVSGIGPKKLDALRGLVAVRNPPQQPSTKPAVKKNSSAASGKRSLR